LTEIKTSRVFDDILKAWVDGKRRVLLEGGTASTKTWSFLQACIVIQEKVQQPLLISVVSESLPHLKKGAIRDFFNILGESQENNPNWKITESTYKRPGWKGSIEFFGADNADKVRGPRRHILCINEGNNVPWETARGLDIRTSVFTIVDWNPVSEFWAHEFWVGKEGNAYSHSTYLDAKEAGVLPAQTIADIEAYKDTDPNWWNIYGLGKLGKIEGLVYPYFDQVDALPSGDVFYGLDFGYTDPVALVKCVVIGKALYSQELIYQSGLTNEDLTRRMVELGIKKGHDEIFADAAEPKSIEEIYRLGFNIKPAPKGEDSVDFGHKKLREYKQYWTKDSLNCIKEQRNFRYVQDKNGKLTDKTTHVWSHGMDARRYAVIGKMMKISWGPA
jgi:phage terminase large subunit